MKTQRRNLSNQNNQSDNQAAQNQNGSEMNSPNNINTIGGGVAGGNQNSPQNSPIHHAHTVISSKLEKVQRSQVMTIQRTNKVSNLKSSIQELDDSMSLSIEESIQKNFSPKKNTKNATQESLSDCHHNSSSISDNADENQSKITQNIGTLAPKVSKRHQSNQPKVQTGQIGEKSQLNNNMLQFSTPQKQPLRLSSLRAQKYYTNTNKKTKNKFGISAFEDDHDVKVSIGISQLDDKSKPNQTLKSGNNDQIVAIQISNGEQNCTNMGSNEPDQLRKPQNNQNIQINSQNLLSCKNQFDSSHSVSNQKERMNQLGMKQVLQQAQVVDNCHQIQTFSSSRRFDNYDPASKNDKPSQLTLNKHHFQVLNQTNSPAQSQLSSGLKNQNKNNINSPLQIMRQSVVNQGSPRNSNANLRNQFEALEGNFAANSNNVPLSPNRKSIDSSNSQKFLKSHNSKEQKNKNYSKQYFLGAGLSSELNAGMDGLPTCLKGSSSQLNRPTTTNHDSIELNAADIKQSSIQYNVQDQNRQYPDKFATPRNQQESIMSRQQEILEIEQLPISNQNTTSNSNVKKLMRTQGVSNNDLSLVRKQQVLEKDSKQLSVFPSTAKNNINSIHNSFSTAFLKPNYFATSGAIISADGVPAELATESCLQADFQTRFATAGNSQSFQKYQKQKNSVMTGDQIIKDQLMASRRQLMNTNLHENSANLANDLTNTNHRVSHSNNLQPPLAIGSNNLNIQSHCQQYQLLRENTPKIKSSSYGAYKHSEVVQNNLNSSYCAQDLAQRQGRQLTLAIGIQRLRDHRHSNNQSQMPPQSILQKLEEPFVNQSGNTGQRVSGAVTDAQKQLSSGIAKDLFNQYHNKINQFPNETLKLMNKTQPNFLQNIEKREQVSLPKIFRISVGEQRQTVKQNNQLDSQDKLAFVVEKPIIQQKSGFNVFGKEAEDETNHRALHTNQKQTSINLHHRPSHSQQFQQTNHSSLQMSSNKYKANMPNYTPIHLRQGGFSAIMAKGSSEQVDMVGSIQNYNSQGQQDKINVGNHLIQKVKQNNPAEITIQPDLVGEAHIECIGNIEGIQDTLLNYNSKEECQFQGVHFIPQLKSKDQCLVGNQDKYQSKKQFNRGITPQNHNLQLDQPSKFTSEPKSGSQQSRRMLSHHLSGQQVTDNMVKQISLSQSINAVVNTDNKNQHIIAQNNNQAKDQSNAQSRDRQSNDYQALQSFNDKDKSKNIQIYTFFNNQVQNKQDAAQNSNYQKKATIHQLRNYNSKQDKKSKNQL